jgi:hypothetical protein
MNISDAKPLILHGLALARLAECAVCSAWAMAPSAIRQAARGPAEIARGRQLAMYLAHVGFGLSFSRTGACFGRDRTTVRHACGRIEDERDEPGFDLAVSALETGLVQLARDLEVAPEAGR